MFTVSKMLINNENLQAVHDNLNFWKTNWGDGCPKTETLSKNVFVFLLCIKRMRQQVKNM